MAIVDTELPRDVQSKMHDVVDEVGEQVARGELVTINVGSRPADLDTVGFITQCTCKRYSKRLPDGMVEYWNKPDPGCKYTHPAALAEPHKIHIAE